MTFTVAKIFQVTLIASSVAAFNVGGNTSHSKTSSRTLSILTKAFASGRDSHTDPISSPAVSSRREWMKDMSTSFAAALTLAFIGCNPESAKAVVFTDPDRYGDKELKIATVNKLRQSIRDAILSDPRLAPLMLKVAVQDALKYKANTEEGGPDGSIVAAILKSSTDPALQPLKPAAEKLSDIASNMKRTTEISMGDVVTFAGAEAIETAGGPRIVVQLGKLDPKQMKGINEVQYPDLCSENNGEAVVRAFLDAGLTEREVALLYGALVAMERTVESIEPAEDEEEEANEMGDKDINIPTSFGGPKEIYGKQLGKSLDGSVFGDVVSDLKKGQKPIANVFNDEKVGEWAIMYAGKKSGFVKDLPAAYGKLAGLGIRYTGGKVGTLLGGQQDAEM